jgi:hypothetical protein
VNLALKNKTPERNDIQHTHGIASSKAVDVSRDGNQWHPRVQISDGKHAPYSKHPDDANPNTAESMVENAHRTPSQSTTAALL